MSATAGELFTQKPKLLLLYDYFEPAYKAGGPAISCANLVRFLEDDFEIRVFTRAIDIDGTVLDVEPDKWVAFAQRSKVFYALSCWNPVALHSVFNKYNPDVVYINGAYSLIGSILPLLSLKLGWIQSRLVIAPRGMLQRSSLKIKRFKKSLFLPMLRWLMNQDLKVHVTSEQELDELVELMPQIDLSRIFLYGNVVRHDVKRRGSHEPGNTLRLVTVALVSPMKQIMEVLKALKGIDLSIEYHLFGPIHDIAYWRECRLIADELPVNIVFKYHGALTTTEVPHVLAGHDIYIQPSKSENFGHSIYEALMTGLPVITSSNTPWQRLEERGAGWNVDTADELSDAIQQACLLSQSAYGVLSSGARTVAEEYNETQNYREDYQTLFSAL